MDNSTIEFICFLCKKTINVSHLRWHLHQMHSIQNNNQSLICYQNGCMRTFDRFSSYKRHLIKCHSNGAELNDNPTAELPLVSPLNPQQDVSLEDENNCDSDALSDKAENSVPIYDITRQSAEFIAKLRASNSMTMQNVNLVIAGASELVESIVSHLQEFVSNTIKYAVGISSDTTQSIVSEIDEHFAEFKNPFSGLETNYLEDRFFEKSGCLIVPEEKVLGHRMDQRNNVSSTCVQQVVVSDTTCYIPISRVLKKFLEQPGVWNSIQSHKLSVNSDTVLRDFHDGEYYKNHGILSDDNCISLGLYNDDMETANPLGSHATIHKLGFLYYIVKNLPPKYNSTLVNCHLLQVYYSADVKKYGFCHILEPFVQEMRKLEVDGLDICVEGKPIHIKVTLGQVSGDNLGMHSLFGFVESFSANYPCRFCTMHKAEMQSNYLEDIALLRSKDVHNRHVNSCIDNPEGAPFYGVMKKSPLNELTYFHVTDNFTPDIMHDWLEGVCGFELKLILCNLINVKKYFDLDLLNDRIRSFNYSVVERGSKPVSISMSHLKSPDGVVKQSASEMWCLVTNLPMLIGDKVPRDDQVWELLLSLLDVMSMVFASAISKGSTYYLQSAIADHLHMFTELFPTQRLRPKQHYLIHYARCIRQVGPLIRFWCMRFEAKHNFFRRLSHVVCNFRNICKTMAMRHQLMQCYNFYIEKHIDSRSQEVGPGNVTILADLDDGYSICNLLGNAKLYEDIFVAKWVTVYGIKYQAEMFLVVSVNAEGEPAFSCVRHIIVIAGKSYFVVQEWQMDHFDGSRWFRHRWIRHRWIRHRGIRPLGGFAIGGFAIGGFAIGGFAIGGIATCRFAIHVGIV